MKIHIGVPADLLLSAIVVIFIFGNFIGLQFARKNINFFTERQAVKVMGKLNKPL